MQLRALRERRSLCLSLQQGHYPSDDRPGERNNTEIHDALYPAGTAGYKIHITGAIAAAH
jgi:hypothetical protein